MFSLKHLEHFLGTPFYVVRCVCAAVTLYGTYGKLVKSLLYLAILIVEQLNFYAIWPKLMKWKNIPLHPVKSIHTSHYIYYHTNFPRKSLVPRNIRWKLRKRKLSCWSDWRSGLPEFSRLYEDCFGVFKSF